MLLALDSSTGTSAAVVAGDGSVLAESSVDDTMRHAEVVGTLIRDVLDAAAIGVSDLTAVACGMGPGPFTGLRIGIAAARTFALATAKPLIPVVSHDAVADAWYLQHSGPLLVVTDARRREVYWSAYGGTSAAGRPVRTGGPALSKPADLDELRDGVLETRYNALSVSAGAIGRVALASLEEGSPAVADEPIYLRSPDVTISSGKRVTA